MGLGDDLLGLLVSSLDDTGALGLGVLTGLENDVGSLTTASVTIESDSARLAIASCLVFSASSRLSSIFLPRSSMVFMMPGRATLASTIQMIRKAISAGMNSAILG